MSRHSTPVATHSFYHADANGNVTCLINDKQVVVAKYLYDPYGNALASSGPMADVNLYRFSSKEVHAPSGLYYYGYRFYEPNLQRWVNRDPIGEQGGRNLFAFVTNDPLNLADSVGLCWEDLLRQAEQAVNAAINDLIGGYPHANSPPVPVTSPLGQFFNQAFKDAMSTLQTLRDNAAGVNGIIPQATAMGASSAGFVFSSAGVETFGAGAVAAAGAGVVSAGLAGAGAGLLIGNYAPGPTGTGSLNQETTEGWVTILEWWYAP
jgi:RHS repeat-associated protein